jgi:hypothetical protein
LGFTEASLLRQFGLNDLQHLGIVRSRSRSEAGVYVDKVRRIIELKSRKFGTTTGWCIDSLDEAAYGKHNWQAVTMAHTADKSSEIFNDIVKFAWDRIHPELRPRKKYNTRTELDFSDTRGSKYIITNDVKGATPNRLHVTEAAYFPKDESIIESFNALPDDALGIAESTAKGMGNWFEMTFTEAWTAKKKQDHEWYAIFHPWFEDPNTRPIRWRSERHPASSSSSPSTWTHSFPSTGITRRTSRRSNFSSAVP